MINIEFAFDRPWLLLLLLPALAIIIIPFLRLPLKRRKTVKKILPVVLHSIIVILLALLLSGFTVVRTSEDQAIMLLLDFSASTQTVQESITEHAQEIGDFMSKKTPLGVIVFGENSICTVDMETKKKDISLTTVSSDATNISSALEYAASLLPSDKAGRIIILTDGKQTDGDAENTAHYLATQGIRIDAVYFDTTELTTAEIQISSFTGPEGAYVNDKLLFTADLKSNTDSNASLSLYDNDELIDTLFVDIVSGSNMIELSTVATYSGAHAYHLVLETETDTITKNNESYAYLNVAGESSILIITDTLSDASALETMLLAEHAVTTVTAPNAPDSIIELCNYDEVILINIDTEELPKEYDKLLETYVNIYGRSLLTVGGTETYMFGNMEGTAFEEMMPVNFSLSEDSKGNSVALMLVLDCSMSMSQQSTYLSVAKQGAIKCVEAMSDNDYVGVISFNRSAYLKSSLIQATKTNKDSLTRIISGLTTSQGTYYTEALELAHEELLKSDAAVKHIIFLSDGNPSDSGYSQAVSKINKDGITVSTIGLGYSSSILSSLAETGGGRYYYVSSASDLPNIMLSETEQVIVSSLVTGEFIPVIAVESELTDGLGTTALPVLTGYLGTTIKENATAYITTYSGHPIYAAWQYGSGTVACFTSDLNGNWSSEWINSAVGQAITVAMVDTTISDTPKNSSLTVDITLRGKTADLVVQTAGTEENSLVTITVMSEFGEKIYTLSQTEFGIYEGRIELDSPGIYELLILETDAEGNMIDYEQTALAFSYSSEYDAFATGGEAFLTNLCNYSDGIVSKNMQALAEMKMPAISLIYNPLVLFGIIVFLLLLADITVRKLRWKDIKNYLLVLQHRTH